MNKVIEHKTKHKNTAIRREVMSVFREIFADPDAGLELRPSFVRRLRASKRSAALGRGKDLKEFLAGKV